MPKTPVKMPANLPKTPKPDIKRPTPKTIPVCWPHPAPSGPKPRPQNTPSTKAK